MKKIIIILSSLIVLGLVLLLIFYPQSRVAPTSQPKSGSSIKTNQVILFSFSSQEEAKKATISILDNETKKEAKDNKIYTSISGVKVKVSPSAKFWIQGRSFDFLVKLGSDSYHFYFKVEKKSDKDMSAEEKKLYEDIMAKGEEENKSMLAQTPLYQYIPIRGVSGSSEYLIDRDPDNWSRLLIQITGNYRAYNSGDKETYYKSIEEGKEAAKEKISSLGEDPEKLESQGRIIWQTH